MSSETKVLERPLKIELERTEIKKKHLKLVRTAHAEVAKRKKRSQILKETPITRHNRPLSVLLDLIGSRITSTFSSASVNIRPIRVHK